MNDSSFQSLREAGIMHIARLARNNWTDHNPSDPGITFLEQLCYAITDLNYRIGFEMPELLAEGGTSAYSALFTPRQVLTTAPVTIDDYRKRLIDIIGVKNASISQEVTPDSTLYYAPFSRELLLAEDRDPLLPEDIYRVVQLQGLMDIQVEPFRNPLGELVVAGIDQTVHSSLQACRSLCTDFEKIAVIDKQIIRLQVGIELGESANPETLLIQIWQLLGQYISPTIGFNTIDLFKENKSIEDIFDGPALNFGFLEKEDLERFQRRSDLRRSDIIRELMTLEPDVKAVRQLNFSLGETTEYSTSNIWKIDLDPNLAAFFDWEGSEIKFFRSNLVVELDDTAARETYRQQFESILPTSLAETDLDFLPTPGRKRNTEHYTSIRQHMPELFGVSPPGLPPGVNNVYQASRRQLSAYLLFFEQLLANYFSQLANAWRLFSIDRTDYQSYFVQSLDNLPATRSIYQNLDSASRLNDLQEKAETAVKARERSNRFLDHLLARFAESFTDYGLLLLGLPQGSPVVSLRSEQLIEDKRAFLRDFPSLSSERATAFDYTGAIWDTENVAGLKKRIARLLGMDNFQRQDLSNGHEGFYLIEHLLLRPRPGDVFQGDALLAEAPVADPYSLRMSILFPAFSGTEDTENRLEQPSFQEFTKRVVRSETPSHIHIDFYWLDQLQMEQFETAYRTFLNALSEEVSNPLSMNEEEVHQFELRIARDRLIDLLCLFGDADTTPPGTPFPIRDLPVPTEVSAVPISDPGDPVLFQGEIRIYYPQLEVSYVLCDRDRRPLQPEIRVSGDNPIIDPSSGRPYIELPTPTIEEDQTFWVRVEKNLKGRPLRFLYLKESIRVRVGIIQVDVSAEPPEIDYGQQITIQLDDSQAGVDYRVYYASDGTTEVEGAGTISGDPAITVSFPLSNIPDGLQEDTNFIVRASRDGFSSSQVVGSVTVRVRANPNLQINVIQPVIAYEGTTNVQILSDFGTGNLSQQSVSYGLFISEIPDWRFVHQVAQPPPASQVTAVSHPFGTALVQRLSIPLGHNPPASFMLVATGEIPDTGADGDLIEFDLSGFNIAEDAFFIVLASKGGHDQPVILNSDNLVHLGVVLVYPDTSPTATVDPDLVSIGSPGRILIANSQAGVKYFLRIQGTDQHFVFHHDGVLDSPRRDGVGFSKVEVDTVVGPVVNLPLALFTDDPLNANMEVEIVAEKVQTGLQEILDTLTISVG